MPTIVFEEQSYACEEGESVLDCLMRHGVLLPSSCQSGVCQTCMMHAVDGDIPEEAQKGLKDTLKVQGYFLACVCKPHEDMEIRQASIEGRRHEGAVSALDRLNASVVRLRLRPRNPLPYRAGQFINLIHQNVIRSYSVASLPREGELELHIKHVPDGRMSSWVHQELKVDDDVAFYGPAGDCFYVPGKRDQPLLLVGTGTSIFARKALSLGFDSAKVTLGEKWTADHIVRHVGGLSKHSAIIVGIGNIGGIGLQLEKCFRQQSNVCEPSLLAEVA